MTDIIKLQQKLDRLIRKSFDSFVTYKKIAKTFDNSKKLMEKNLDIEQIEKKTKLQTIPKLVKIGLTAEQVAEMLELPLNEVQEIVRV